LKNKIIESEYGNYENPQPKKMVFTIEQLARVKVDPTFKLVMFYNMACCYQRLQLFNECAEYLEFASVALKERIAILEDQEQAMLHNKLAASRKFPHQ
jgi:hypothetical protein